MAFTVKYAQYEDLLACSKAEQDTMGSYHYLLDAWHYFNSIDGEMICVYDGEKLVGIGRFSVLHDGTGWLETLRVIPEYQGKGVGKLIYLEYLKLAKVYNCPSMAMFTGVNNAASAGLARINGLEVVTEHTGYSLTNFDGGENCGFKPVNFTKAVELILPLKDEFNNYFSSNRTFFHINEANIKGYAIEGKVYHDEESGSTIVCGARFQQHVALHIPLMHGDLDKCIAFAKSLAKAVGTSKVTCTFARENEKLEKALEAAGFEKEASNLITMEVCF